MQRIGPRMLGALGASIAFILAGCDGTRQPLTPEAPAAAPVSGVLHQGRHDYTAISSIEQSYTVTGEFGRQGGTLRIQEPDGDVTHMLDVPPRAISSRTTFTMTSRGDGTIAVDLTAVDRQGRDVGVAGFDRPVYLFLSLKNAVGLDAEQLNDLRIAWERPDGSLEVQPSWVTANGWYVVARLKHLSGYIIVGNLLEVSGE